MEHRFDGRVAIVTGAGRGIGRAHARLLGSRGAKVVVNDLGGSMGGAGADAGPASAVVEEITAAGGAAIADGSDVATPEGAAALVDRAVDAFGRLDALINNAGIIRWGALADVELEDLERHLAVHLVGSFNTIRAAWPHMVEARYGRIVNTTSTGVFGLPENLAYAAAKGGVIGMTRSLATAGARHGIRVNLLAPAALTRMAGQSTADPAATGQGAMAPDLVAPMAAFLVHESCPVSGEIYTAGAGRFARLFLASTVGAVVTDHEPTVEDVAEQWAAINDETGYAVPADLHAWSATFLAHLQSG